MIPGGELHAVLDGGPRDGETLWISRTATRVNGVFTWPIPALFEHPPKPAWPWQRPWRILWWRRELAAWKAWRPPLIEPRQDYLIWERTSEQRDGCQVFALTTPWEPYTITVDGPLIFGQLPSLHAQFVAAATRCHPMIRYDPHTRFVISPFVLAALKQEALPFLPPPDPPPFRPVGVLPPPELPPAILGLPVEVRTGADPPTLINQRFPAGWPNYA